MIEAEVTCLRILCHNGVLSRDKKSLIRLSEILHKGKGGKKGKSKVPHIIRRGRCSQDFRGAT